MTKEQEQQFEQVFKEKLQEQFTNGMRQGAYGIAGAVHDMIQANKGGNNTVLINKIEQFLIPALGLNKKKS